MESTLYVKNSAQAVSFYKKLFGLTLGYHEVNADGSYLHASLMKGNQEVFAVSEGTGGPILNEMRQATLEASRPTMCFGYKFETEQEVKDAFDLLREKGTVLLDIGPLPWCKIAAEVVDSFGVYWYIYAS